MNLRAVFGRGQRVLSGFLGAEDGLVTVEWVALAGSLAIGAITVGWIILNGLKEPANSIGNTLSDCQSTAASNGGSTSGCK
jgi:hypothetical protein